MRSKWTWIVGVCLLLETFTLGIPWRQHVRLALTRQGGGLAARRFRLISGPSAVCAAPGLEGSTDIDGSFEGTRWQWSTFMENFEVVVRRDALCLLQSGGAWVLAWHSPYGPAPRLFVLTCNLPNEGSSDIVTPTPSIPGRGPCRLGEGP
jgi:hypothetical protein